MKNKVQVNTAAEVISVFGTILISVPFIAQLTSGSKPSRMPIWAPMLWSLGLFLFGVYFNRHPVIGGRHHHIITDVVGYPVFFHFLPYIASALAWATGLRDKYLQARSGGPSSSFVRSLFKWVVGPIVLAAHVLVLTKMCEKYFSYKSNQLKTMGAIGIFGGFVFCAGNYVLASASSTRVDRDLWLLQTLGLFVWLINTTLMFTNVDWLGVTAITVMLVGNVALLGHLAFTNKTHSYEELRDEIAMDDLPTSRPRSRVQHEEF